MYFPLTALVHEKMEQEARQTEALGVVQQQQTFKKRNMLFLNVGAKQTLPFLLQLHDKRNFTRSDLQVSLTAEETSLCNDLSYASSQELITLLRDEILPRYFSRHNGSFMLVEHRLPITSPTIFECMAGLSILLSHHQRVFQTTTTTNTLSLF